MNKYLRKRSTNCSYIYLSTSDDPRPDGMWPSPFNCLVHFSWALRACRYFYNALSYGIKIDGESATETLKNLQYARANEIMDGYNGEISEAWNVVLFPKLAGYFLKNEKVIDSSLVERILGANSPPMEWCSWPTSKLLIPRLEEWVKRHATLSDCSCFVTLEVTRDGGRHGDLMSFKKGARVVHKPGISIYSIARVACIEDRRGFPEPVYPCNYSLPMIKEIMDSEPNSWWLFLVSEHDYPEDIDGYFVNYTKGKIFEAYNCEDGYSWNNQWYSDSWSRD